MTSLLPIRRWAHRLSVLGAIALLTACAQQRIRNESQALLRQGEPERAVATLEQGLKAHPDSALLRAGLVQARAEALTRLLAQAGTARAAGRLDEAEALLKRAQAVDPTAPRVNALLQDMAVERRQRRALEEAEALAQRKQPEAALRRLADALKDNPRQAELLGLQRRIEAELRQQQVLAAQQGLAETRPISLDFRDAGLRTVLDVVTRHSGVNFILDKDIRADTRITVFLRSARVEDAIDLIVSTHQLAKKVVDSQTIVIYPNTPEKQREHQEQVVRVFYLASADAKGAAAFLRSMLKIRDPYVDERSNLLAVRESPENIVLAERLIALYDMAEPEVLLELEVIEVRSSRLLDLGVKLPDSFSLSIVPPAGGLTVGNVRDLGRNDIALGVGNVLVNLRREVGDVNTLANPRIRARNKEKARVLIGDKVPVITTTTGQGGFVSDSVSYLDVGLKLDVEPTVYADDEVAIRVALEVSSVAREVRTGSGGLAYQIGTRNASTLLRLKDGETQLLAGLISNEERSSASRVPGLGDLPVMGRIFSSQRDDAQRTELVLAITPRVLRNVRQASASETELWVGTEASPRLRPVGGRIPSLSTAAPGPGAAASAPAPAGQGVRPVPPTAAGTAPAPGAQATAGPVLQARWLAPAEVKGGETFTVTLELESAAPVRGAPLQLSYDKERLTLVDIEEGEFFRQGGAATSFSKSIDAAQGQARVGVLRTQTTGASGRGAGLTLRFKALTAGAGRVALDTLTPITLGGEPVRAGATEPLLVQVK